LPEGEIAISTSPARPSPSTCRANTSSRPKSLTMQVSAEESVLKVSPDSAQRQPQTT
jgi:hypothetical protein